MPTATLTAPLPQTRPTQNRTFRVALESAAANLGPEAIAHEPRVGPYQLFPFQERTMKRLAGQRDAVVLARSGIGKVEVAIAAAAEALAEQNDIERVVILTLPALVTCTADLITQTTGHTDVLCANTPLGQRWRSYAGPERWVVIPYSCVDKDRDVLRATMGNTMLIIDSAVAVKNPTSDRARATRHLVDAATRRLMALSPSDVHYADEWNTLISLALSTTRAENLELADATRLARANLVDLAMVTITANN